MTAAADQGPAHRPAGSAAAPDPAPPLVILTAGGLALVPGKNYHESRKTPSRHNTPANYAGSRQVEFVYRDRDAARYVCVRVFFCFCFSLALRVFVLFV